MCGGAGGTSDLGVWLKSGSVQLDNYLGALDDLGVKCMADLVDLAAAELTELCACCFDLSSLKGKIESKRFLRELASYTASV